MTQRDPDPDLYGELNRGELIELLCDREASCRMLAAESHYLQLQYEQVRSQEHELLEAQRALAEAHERQVDLYDLAPVAYLTLDGHGLMLEANLTAAGMLRRPRNQLINAPLLSHIATEDCPAFLEHMRRCRSSDEPVRSLLRIAPQAWAAQPVELISRRDRSCASRFLTVALDLRERAADEEQRLTRETERRAAALREQTAREASAAKDRFLAVLSHELRAPLTPLLLTAEALVLAETDPEKLRRLEMIRRNVEVQTRLVDDLLDMTRLIRQQLRLLFEPCDLHQLASHVLDEVAPLAVKHGVALERRLAAGAVQIHADRMRIQQVIRNLLSNAIKFTPNGGRVVVTTDQPRPGWVRLEVSDTGRGFSGVDAERMFEPFEQLLPEGGTGLGLGLAIAKRLVRAHGGTLYAHSAGPGSGARFAFELRLSHALLHEPPEHTRSTPPQRASGQWVLVVEDHEDTSQVVAEILESNGYRTRRAHSLNEARAEFERGCDALLSDLQLPDGSGYELLAQLPKGLPAVALSGFGSEEDLQRSKRAGFAEHLVKPISGPELLEALQRALARATREQN